jgi:ATP-dependent Clp protease ATP-binding subunit ClpA
MKPLAQTEFPLLTRYTDDLTLQIAPGQRSPAIDATDQVYVDRVLQVLHRRHKNDPILIGEDPVRKLSIVHEVVRQIVGKQLPENRTTHIDRVCGFNQSAFFAGEDNSDVYRDRLTALLQEIQCSLLAPIVLFVDDLHHLIGTHNETTKNAGRVFVTAHARGEIQFIGATTLGNYQQALATGSLWHFERHSQAILIE